MCSKTAAPVHASSNSSAPGPVLSAGLGAALAGCQLSTIHESNPKRQHGGGGEPKPNLGHSSLLQIRMAEHAKRCPKRLEPGFKRNNVTQHRPAPVQRAIMATENALCNSTAARTAPSRNPTTHAQAADAAPGWITPAPALRCSPRLGNVAIRSNYAINVVRIRKAAVFFFFLNYDTNPDPKHVVPFERSQQIKNASHFVWGIDFGAQARFRRAKKQEVGSCATSRQQDDARPGTGHPIDRTVDCRVTLVRICRKVQYPLLTLLARAVWMMSCSVGKKPSLTPRHAWSGRGMRRHTSMQDPGQGKLLIDVHQKMSGQ